MKTITIYPKNELKCKRNILIGRSYGELLRETLKSRGESLEYLESKYDTIIIDFTDVHAINASFFSGAFGSRVRELGVHEFMHKYQFICMFKSTRDYIGEMLDKEISDMMQEKAYDVIREVNEKHYKSLAKMDSYPMDLLIFSMVFAVAVGIILTIYIN